MDKLYNNLNENDKKIEQNKNILLKLKEHQKTSIAAMLDFENEGKVTFTKKSYVQNFHIYDEENGYYYRYHDENNKFEEMRFALP